MSVGSHRLIWGYEGDQQQSHDHAQVEGQSGANHLFHRTLGNSGADEQHRANGRGEQADTAVEHEHDTIGDGIDADGRCMCTRLFLRPTASALPTT